jgi:predicted metal-dependent HD superfamily phosphohydrolase
VAGVRQEFVQVPDEVWRFGRAKVLAALRGKGSIFSTPAARARFEKQARRNLEAELRALGVGADGWPVA